MFIKIDPLNEAGHEVIALYRAYHQAFRKEEKESILAIAEGKIKNNPFVREAFLGRFEGELFYALCQTAYFASDVRIAKELETPVSEYLVNKGVDFFEVYPYRERGQRKTGLICVERRIGIKANDIADVNHFSISETKPFFRDGHAEAFLQFIVIPALRDLLIKPEEENYKVSIKFCTERTRGYLENIKIQFIVSFSVITESPKALNYIAEKIKQIDKYKKEHRLLF